MEDTPPQIAPFDPTKKKKKKKVSIQHHKDESLHSSTEKKDMLPLIEGGRKVYLGLANKKRAGETCMFMDYNTDVAEDLCDNNEEDVKEDAFVQQSRYSWEESERDYEYKELLERVFGFLHEYNPELAGDKQRTVFRPPQIFPEGTTMTIFANFMDLCKVMHRQPEQVMTFMLIELGTSGSLDGENRFVVQGRFASKTFETVLQNYIYEYVLCHICRCPDTILSEENLIFLLQCELCGSERSVTLIGAGYTTPGERRKSR